MSYEPKENDFFIKAKQTVFKWWCVVYKPVYKLTHHGRWPMEQQQRFDMLTGQNNSTSDEGLQQRNKLAADIAMQIQNDGNQNKVDAVFAKTPSNANTDEAAKTELHADVSDDTSNKNISSDVLDRANEIMERLAREAAEDEAKKQAEIEKARRTAEENAKLASIMNANKVDISPFIEEGKAHQAKQESKGGDITI